ncbi:MAG: hypothetical protein AB1805_14760 [Nitrospirota bacterium]
MNSSGSGQGSAPSTQPLLFRLLASGLCVLLLISCAPKQIERPAHAGVALEDALAALKAVDAVEAVLSIDYEKSDSVMSGDAFLKVSESMLTLRLYYLGFLAGEVTEENGVVKSKPKLDRNKSAILVDGLKNSFLWWNIDHYTVQENETAYIVRNYNRRLVISKETLLPVEQTIELDSGDKLSISYDVPVKNTEQALSLAADSLLQWYQSHLTIQLKKHVVRVKVKSLAYQKF